VRFLSIKSECYRNLFDMKQKIKNKFVLKSATCNRVLKLGTIAATSLTSSLKQESEPAREDSKACA
jgi:hypothetical protein